MRAHQIILFLGLFLGANTLGAQQDTLYYEDAVLEDSLYEYNTETAEVLPDYVPPPATKPRPIDEEIWKKSSEGLDYSADRQEEEPEKERPKFEGPNLENWQINGAWWGKLLQAFVVVLTLAGIAYGIYRMLKAPKNSKVRRGDVSITSDNLEEYLLDSDLDIWLREALAAGNYPLAVRIHFLQMIKLLALGNHLKLSMEKTNRDYLRELRGHRDFEKFRNLTRSYEEVWYGNRPVDKEAYERLAVDFKSVS